MKALMIAAGIGLGIASGCPAGFAADSSLRPTQLRCEYLKDPEGIDVLRQRLQWLLEPIREETRSQKQTAYQVLAASDHKKLEAGKGDLWNSGKIRSDQSIQVLYGGAALGSNQQCYWKVRVWDQDGKASDWSKTAFWSMGLLKPSDWKARWIGKDEVETTNTLAGTHWVWFPEGDPAAAAPVGTRFFRRVFALPPNAAVEKARILIAADNEFTLYVNGKQAGKGGSFKVAETVDLREFLLPGANCLAVSANNVGTGENPAGLIALVQVEFVQGQGQVSPLTLATDQEWRASDQGPAGWERGAFDDSGWARAKVLGAAGAPPWGDVTMAGERRLSARMLRREFTVQKPLRRAVAHVSGLGLFELYVNDQRVGDHALSPGLTEYPKRVFYVTFDLTEQVKPGPNALGVILGNGRYYAPRNNVPTATGSYGFPKLLLQVHLQYQDGASELVVSDPTWRLTTEGPIRANNEYDGEEYDARKEIAGWALPGFNDAAWEPAREVAAPGGTLVAQMIEPIRVVETVSPVSIAQPKPGVYVIDMGQNMVGWCRLEVSGPAGAKVTLRHAEAIQPDGMLYMDNLRSAKVTDTYVLKGTGKELYEPRFTYHGFRYVELRGYPGEPDLACLDGRVVHDDLASAGDFRCSNETLNRIFANVRWGVRGNYRSLPTDCPQRDERQGWLGDRCAESRGEAYLFNIAALYRKWLGDMADAQKDSGSVPDVAPSYWPIYSDNVTWPSSTVVIPNALYELFADRDILQRHYPSMKRWIEYMAGFIKDDILARDQYGDWCVPPEEQSLIHSKDPKRKTAPEVLATAQFYCDLRLMARYAALLGAASDSQRYQQLAERLKTAFNKRFLDVEKSIYDNGSQTSCVLPLAFDLTPPPHRQRVFDHLIDKITQESRNHIGTGLVGGQWLMRTLSNHGRDDLAYILASQRTYPSWGYMIEKGATTIWELWNGDTADPAMNSGNHVMLVGDLVIWLFERLAGIAPDPDEPGFKHVRMQPHPVGDLEYVHATHQSPYGRIASRWERRQGTFRWQVIIPPNASATVHIPARAADSVRDGEKPAAQAPGVKFLRMERDCAVFEIGSGVYAFQSGW